MGEGGLVRRTPAPSLPVIAIALDQNTKRPAQPVEHGLFTAARVKTPAPSPPSCIAPKPSIIRTSLLREVSHSQEQEQQQHISLTGATVVSSPGSMSRHSCEKCHLATSQIQADKKMVGTYFANGRSALSEACNRRNTPIQIANDDRTNFIHHQFVNIAISTSGESPRSAFCESSSKRGSRSATE